MNKLTCEVLNGLKILTENEQDIHAYEGEEQGGLQD